MRDDLWETYWNLTDVDRVNTQLKMYKMIMPKSESQDGDGRQEITINLVDAKKPEPPKE